MKQSELIDLIGLKSTDQKLVAFFEKNNLGKPPKTINSNQGSKSIHYKALNLSFWFEYDIKNDNFQPPICTKNDNYTFIAYLSEVDFLHSSISSKKPDLKNNNFWDISPEPNSSLEVIKEKLGVPKSESERFITFVKQLNAEKVLLLRYSKRDSMLTEGSASIKTHSKIIEYFEFDSESVYNKNLVPLNTMIIKWLFDNKFLKSDEPIYDIQLENSVDSVLPFVQNKMNSHLWDNQIIDTPFLRAFLFQIRQNNSHLMNENRETVKFYDKLILMTALNKVKEYEKISQEVFENNYPFVGSFAFNDENFAKFSKTMTEQFEMYKKLKALDVNKNSWD